MMGQTNVKADPQRFWTIAAMLGGHLANEGEERTTDPLVWVAALHMAQEAVLKAGGAAMRKDWEKALKGRERLAKQGIVVSIDAAEEDPAGG